jgi:hypothetical protein
MTNQRLNLFLFNAHDNAEASANPATSPVLNVKKDGIFCEKLMQDRIMLGVEQTGRTAGRPVSQDMGGQAAGGSAVRTERRVYDRSCRGLATGEPDGLPVGPHEYSSYFWMH